MNNYQILANKIALKITDMIILPKDKLKEIVERTDLSLGGIYIIINLVTLKIYIGSTDLFSRRLACHNDNIVKKKGSQRLRNSYIHHGPDAFIVVPVHTILQGKWCMESFERYLEDIENLVIDIFWDEETQQKWKGYLYNTSKNPGRPPLREELPEETQMSIRVKISKARTGSFHGGEAHRQACFDRRGKYKAWNSGMKMPPEHSHNVGLVCYHDGEKEYYCTKEELPGKISEGFSKGRPFTGERHWNSKEWEITNHNTGEVQIITGLAAWVKEQSWPPARTSLGGLRTSFKSGAIINGFSVKSVIKG